MSRTSRPIMPSCIPIDGSLRRGSPRLIIVIQIVTVRDYPSARRPRVLDVGMRRSERKEKDPNVGILSAKVLWAFERELFAKLAEQGHPDVRPRHGAVLAFLDREGTRASDLARLSGRHKQVITTLIDELAELGYVERRPDPDDRRAKTVLPA